VPENAIVAFGVFEEKLRDGKLPSDADGVETELATDVTALRAALQQHPALFRYLSKTSKTEAGPQTAGL